MSENRFVFHVEGGASADERIYANCARKRTWHRGRMALPGASTDKVELRTLDAALQLSVHH